MFADHYQLTVLIVNLHQLDHKTKARFFMIRLVLYLYFNPDRIPDKHRTGKAEPLIPIGHRHGIDLVGSQPNGNTEDQRAMRNSLLKRLRLTPFLVHMMGEKITGLSSMKNDISFGDRSPDTTVALPGSFERPANAVGNPWAEINTPENSDPLDLTARDAVIRKGLEKLLRSNEYDGIEDEIAKLPVPTPNA